MHISIWIIIAWNIIVMLVYGADKFLAKRQKRRISDNALLTIALLMGGLGAMFGMVLFNHKNSRLKFRLAVPGFVLLNIAVYFLFKS